mmetsp:Transcript_38346/g.50307  ORF Transcript_38346/g.50307 Transcript_38346/m.50307 type:complete len:118 (+) Transcript_38346:136-489(+)
MERELRELREQNQNLRGLLKTKMNSQESMPEGLKQKEESVLSKATSVSDERFKVVTICFKPEVSIAENDTIAIMGEFTNWMPEIMERFDCEKVLLEPELANTFYYKTKLFRGFKYRY